MSRCYPYLTSKAQRSAEGALREPCGVDSFKIQNGREKRQSDPLKKKRVKEDKSKVRKRDEGNPSFGNKCHKSEKSLFAMNKEEEQERSDLTEEHDEPVHSVRCSFLTGSSQDSSKRDKDESTSSASVQRRNIIRIRLPSRKPTSSDDAQLCSSSGREDAFPRKQEQHPILLTKQNVTFSPGHTISTAVPKSLSSFEETSVEKPSSSGGSKNKRSATFEKAFSTDESLYKSLIEDWVPPILQPVEDDFEQDWLFVGKRQAQNIRPVDSKQDGPCIGSSDMYPRAEYLRESDVYALPFTVPF